MSETRGWSRREFLKGAGACIGLPFFPSLFPGAAWADNVPPPRRLMFMSVPLGFVPNKWIIDLQPECNSYGEGWFPSDEGPGYTLPIVHAALAPFRQSVSFLKGLSNPLYRGETHYGDDVLLTCADTFADPTRAFSNSISCDQVAAASAAMGGAEVRYPSLALGIEPVLGTHTGGLSWGQNGVPVTPLTSPAMAFDRLFGKDDLPQAVRLQRLQQKKSIMDIMLGQIATLKGKLNAADRQKLDETLTAVEGVETEIQREEKWLGVPKPVVGLPRPDEEGITCKSSRHTQSMLALAHAAFLTDSTRIITYELPAFFTEITHLDKHGINHSSDPVIEAASIRLDTEVTNQVAAFLKLLSDSKEHDGTTLLHQTLATLGSGVWGRNHCVKDLPVLLMGHGGGAIKQGATHKYPAGTPMANLWLTMLNACGVGVKAFGDSTGALADLT